MQVCKTFAFCCTSPVCSTHWRATQPPVGTQKKGYSMQATKTVHRCLGVPFVILLLPPTMISAQQNASSSIRPSVSKSLKTPLPPEIIEQLTNALFGQMIY